jgi:hypothetical protein
VIKTISRKMARDKARRVPFRTGLSSGSIKMRVFMTSLQKIPEIKIINNVRENE